MDSDTCEEDDAAPGRPGDAVWTELVRAHDTTCGAIDDVPPHEPVAAILACSDARVPPSVVFDQPSGTLFVVRIAGNTASSSAVASLDYAVAQLGVPLVVVLGHTGCGAVTAAVEGTCTGDFAPIVAPICSLARANPDLDVDAVVERNVAETVRALCAHEGPTGQAIRAGAVEIRGAVHDLRGGRLRAVDAPTVV